MDQLASTQNQASVPSAAGDWGQMFRDIISYGATRYFDSQAVDNLYHNGNSGMGIAPDGTVYTLGQSGQRQVVAQTGLPPAVLLIGAGLLVYLLVKG